MPNSDKEISIKDLIKKFVKIRRSGHREDNSATDFLLDILGYTRSRSDEEIDALLIKFVKKEITAPPRDQDLLLMAFRLLQGYEGDDIKGIGSRRKLYVKSTNFWTVAEHTEIQNCNDDEKLKNLWKKICGRLQKQENTRIRRLACKIARISDMATYIEDIGEYYNKETDNAKLPPPRYKKDSCSSAVAVPINEGDGHFFEKGFPLSVVPHNGHKESVAKEENEVALASSGPINPQSVEGIAEAEGTRIPIDGIYVTFANRTNYKPYLPTLLTVTPDAFTFVLVSKQATGLSAVLNSYNVAWRKWQEYSYDELKPLTALPNGVHAVIVNLMKDDSDQIWDVANTIRKKPVFISIPFLINLHTRELLTHLDEEVISFITCEDIEYIIEASPPALKPQTDLSFLLSSGIRNHEKWLALLCDKRWFETAVRWSAQNDAQYLLSQSTPQSSPGDVDPQRQARESFRSQGYDY